MIYVLNRQEQIADILEVNKERSYFGDWHVQDLKEGSETYYFSTKEDIEQNATIVLKTPSGDLIPFIVQKIVETSKYKKTKTYYCDAEYLELRYTKILSPQVLTGQTPAVALNYGLQGTRFQVGIVDSNLVKDINISEYMSLLKYVRYLSTEYNLEMRFRVEFSGNTISARYVDLLQRVGTNDSKEVTLGKDLDSVERTIDNSAIVTALYGIGPTNSDGSIMTIASVNGGQVYVSDSDALQRWGKGGEHRFDIFTPSVDTNDLTPSLLLTLTQQELQKRINSIVSYVASAVDMYEVFGFSHERVFLGDTTRIKDTSFTPILYLESRVIKIERSYTDPDKDQYTLGDFVEVDIDNYISISQIKSLLNSNREKWNKSESNANLYTDSQITTVNQSISGVSQSVTDLNTYVDGSFKDGVISGQEAATLKTYLNALTTEKSNLDERYNQIYNNSNLTDATKKSNLQTSKSNYDTAHTNLVNSINTAISDNIISDAERTDVNDKFSSYNTALVSLAGALEIALTSTVDKVGDNAYNAAVADAEAYYNQNAVMTGVLYNGISITNSDGFLAVRNDQLVRAVLNATEGICIQRRLNTSSPWTDMFYVDSSGKLYVVNAEISGNLNAATGTFSGSLSSATGTFSGTISTSQDALIGRNIQLGTYDTSSQKAIKFNGTDTWIYTSGSGLVIDSLGYLMLEGTVNTHATESGFCGVGGVGTNVTSAVAGVGVNFKLNKVPGYAPSSVSFSSLSNNIGGNPSVANITEKGFWMYVNGDGTNSYKYWRGTYSC